VLRQGKPKAEAREMVLDALAGMLKLRAAEHEAQGKDVGRESLAIGASIEVLGPADRSCPELVPDSSPHTS
jgi:hypothetical protein